MSRRYGQPVGESVMLPYDIVDVMEDPDFMQHFLRRFAMACEKNKACGKLIGPKSWYWVYRDRPMDLYKDALDDIKVMLGRQKSSAAILPVGRTMQSIILPAVSDWVCEKEGRIPEREVIPNSVHTLPIPFENYYVKKQQPKAKDGGKTPGTTLDLGNPGTPPVREESPGGDRRS